MVRCWRGALEMVLEGCSWIGAGGAILDWCWRGDLGMLLEGWNGAKGVNLAFVSLPTMKCLSPFW